MTLIYRSLATAGTKSTPRSRWAGGRLLTQTVELATGLHLDHYAEVGFSEFADLVDAFDPLAGVDLPAGCQTLDGRAALGYVRTRATPRADLEGSDVPVPAAAFETQP